MYDKVYKVICTVAIIGSITRPMAQRLTHAAAAMLGETATSDVGGSEGSLDAFAGLFPSFLDHLLDDLYVHGCPEDSLQLLLRRFAQESLVTLVGEECLKSCERGQTVDNQSTRQV
jgi:hypothetical protein